MTQSKPTTLEAIQAALDDAIRRVRTFVPANVTRYTPPTPATAARCEVQVAERLADLEGRTAPIPPIPGVPIAWPAFGSLMIWGDLAPGDEVMLGVPASSIGGWLAKNGPFDPESARRFNLGGAVAFPMAVTLAKGAEAGAGFLNIGTRDGAAMLRVSSSGAEIVARAPLVKLGSEAAASPVALAPELAAVLADAVADAVAASIPEDGGTAAFTAFGATLAAAVADFTATKVVAE